MRTSVVVAAALSLAAGACSANRMSASASAPASRHVVARRAANRPSTGSTATLVVDGPRAAAPRAAVVATPAPAAATPARAAVPVASPAVAATAPAKGVALPPSHAGATGAASSIGGSHAAAAPTLDGECDECVGGACRIPGR